MAFLLKKNKDQIKAIFPSWDLEAGMCYTLEIKTDAVELREGKLEHEDFNH